jgi:transcriptional regulator with XRE-family HTH domain
MKFGERLRELRKERRLTLRALAEAVHVDFTYLSKIENGKVGYLPGADTIRALAEALETDTLELLELADKVPPEMQRLTSNANARRFLKLVQDIDSPDDWDALLKVLEDRQKNRSQRKEE